MAPRGLDESWKAWLKENLERRCDPPELLGILRKNDFTLASIKESMGENFPQHASILATLQETPADIDYEALSNVRLTSLHPSLRINRFPSEKIQLYTIDNFMLADECDVFAALVGRTLRASTVTMDSPADKYFRTSSTSDLSLLNDATVAALDRTIARALGIQPAYSEGLQGQHYAVGQEFKPHTDFFEPGTEEFAAFGETRGNRTWTFMVYLNDVAQGGGTHFVNLRHVFQPCKGQAVIWNNLYADGTPNYDTLHAGLPVEEGEKIVITKWFRERGRGPMFFSD